VPSKHLAEEIIMYHNHIAIKAMYYEQGQIMGPVRSRGISLFGYKALSQIREILTYIYENEHHQVRYFLHFFHILFPSVRAPQANRSPKALTPKFANLYLTIVISCYLN